MACLPCHHPQYVFLVGLPTWLEAREPKFLRENLSINVKAWLPSLAWIIPVLWGMQLWNHLVLLLYVAIVLAARKGSRRMVSCMTLARDTLGDCASSISIAQAAVSFLPHPTGLLGATGFLLGEGGEDATINIKWSTPATRFSNFMHKLQAFGDHLEVAYR